MTEDWTKQWERRIVNGVYPLRRFLGRSDHSVVFLTECKAQNVAQAAIKILPAKPALIEAQLAHWSRLASLSHPHLMRLLEAGRCQLGGHNFLFFVMDYAEQNLAQILRGRRLTPEEVRDLLPATLDAATYLHSKNLVLGSLKPSNFLAVGDQLKLASDTIRPAGERTANTAKPSLYDPPEARNGRGSTAGDIWGLGITLVEALTQSPPAWSRERPETISLPANLAPEFVDTVQRCLNLDPGRRPVIADLAAQFNTAAPPTPSAAPPAMKEPLVRTLSTQISPRTRLLATAITVGIVILWAVWTGVHMFHTHASAQQSAPLAPAAPAAVPPPAAVVAPKASTPAPLPTVLHQELPEPSRSARESIRGVIDIAVRVNVDHSGNVVAAALDSRGSNRYFARIAVDAAKKWKFGQVAEQDPRAWLLHFEFTRTGTSADASLVR
jgi:hypothetical protein